MDMTDRKDKGKQIRFDGVELPAQKTGRPGPRAASVAEKVVFPAIKAMRSKSATPPKVLAPVANTPLSSTSPSTSNLFQTDSANFSSSFNPQGQFRYSFPLEDETALKCLLDQVLATTCQFRFESSSQWLPKSASNSRTYQWQSISLSLPTLYRSMSSLDITLVR